MDNPQYRFKVATASTYEKALEKVAVMKENGKVGRIRRISDCFVVQEVRSQAVKVEPELVAINEEVNNTPEQVATQPTEKPKRYMRGH